MPPAQSGTWLACVDKNIVLSADLSDVFCDPGFDMLGLNCLASKVVGELTSMPSRASRDDGRGTFPITSRTREDCTPA